MRTPGPVAIVVPLAEEFATYPELLGKMRRLEGCGPWEIHEGTAGDRRVVVVISDCGPANAGAATERVITQFDPVAVLHGGSAGAHNPALIPGDLVIGSLVCILAGSAEQESRRERGLHPKRLRFRRDGLRVHLDRGQSDPRLVELAVRDAREVLAGLGAWVGPGWPPGVPHRGGQVVVGIIGSADTWTVTADDIRALREAYRTDCEDMESAFVAQVCAMHNLPFLVVRAASNNDSVCPLAPGEVAGAVTAAGARAARVLARVAAEL